MSKAPKELTKTQQQEADKRYRNPHTKEYRIYRSIWLILLASAIGLGCFTLLNVATLPDIQRVVIIAIANIFIVVAIFIDITKTRRIRKTYQREMMAPKSKAQRTEEKKQHAASCAAAKETKDTKFHDPEEEQTFIKKVIARANASGETANIKGSGL